MGLFDRLKAAKTGLSLDAQGNLVISEYEFSRYLENNEALVIPTGCRHIPALTIDQASDLQLFRLKALILPEGLEEIGDYAFWGAGISQLALPKSLKRIGERAFCACDDLAHVVFQEGLIEIGEEAFDDCGELTEARLPSTLKILGNNAFSSTGIRSLTLPDALKHCGWVASTTYVNTLEHWLAMDHDFNLDQFKLVVGGTTLRDVTLPGGLVELKDSTFQHCTINSITLPASLRRIGDGALDATHIDRLDLPDGFESIYAQFDLKRVDYVRVPDSIRVFSVARSNLGLTENPSEGFNGQINVKKDVGIKFLGNERNPYVVTIDYSPSPYGNTQLEIPSCCRIIGDESLATSEYESIVIPDSVVSIGSLAFAQSPNLSDVFVPASVHTIGVLVFAQCPRLHKIRYGGTTAQWKKIENLYAEKDKTWHSLSNIDKVVCTDGIVYLEE